MRAYGAWNDGYSTWPLPTSARWLFGSLPTRDDVAHAGRTVYTNAWAVGAPRPSTGLAVKDQGVEAAQYLVPLDATGAFQLAADSPAWVTADVAGYFSAVAGDDGNGRGLLYVPAARWQLAASGQVNETEFGTLTVRGPGLLPPEAVAMAGRLFYEAGAGESAGSSMSVVPSGNWLGSWGADVLGSGYPDTTDEATFVRRLPDGTLDVGPGSPDIGYARGALDAAGYFVLAP